MDEPIRCTGPDSFGRIRPVMTRSSWLSTSHFAPPDAPAIVPIRSSANPRFRMSSQAPGPALNLSACFNEFLFRLAKKAPI